MFSYLNLSYRYTRHSAVMLFEDRLSLLPTGESEDCESLILYQFFHKLCLTNLHTSFPEKKLSCS